MKIEMPEPVVAGENLDASVMGVHQVFPWEKELRDFSPVVEYFSHLRSYWYRAKRRWVLYTCLPAHLIDPDKPVRVGLLGSEFFDAVHGKPPREREGWDESPVSDVQHEFYRLYKVYAVPFWVLQGDSGGHQVAFTPWQANICLSKSLPCYPPVLGGLPPCPFDERVLTHLRRQNRLAQLGGKLYALQQSGNREFADKEMAAIEKEIRLAESATIEAQMEPIVDMALSLVRGSKTRSEHRDQVVEVSPGMASAASDAYDHYLESGDYILGRDLTTSKPSFRQG